ncbi:4-(cytidine 5'-diphospho)-2-C-methyl-D-erythritol kinase [Dysgonomonas sp. 25]|uniref:4-(cytidine 5'-diphospho)-2-C-methyl-D-erythritol kinase n=1 Tax=Dysgonomonas sp. 25 TaxID=2302933 RepID=UPI0013D518A2|nr:4-(cytidine 5'-diphospho)-2-C-methyl-D-erythritol kinase [Dysgonomonas sp. 25]NDV68283.1 4-(cytidine 5'-diphospho)-2-C-methyl-D-erythritol kinase [Dysgonomonas sp. 25]
MICFPNAKINLGLNIVSKRADGYHNLETIFYPIPIKDALEILPKEDLTEDIFVEAGIKVDASPENNLVMKALRLMRTKYNFPYLEVHLLKKIPFGAGLGGGSADASFMLRLINDSFDLGATKEELAALAVQLGADCPFFIYNQPVFASGIGEVFKEVNISLKGYYFILVKPDIHIPTKDAFAQIVPTKPTVSLTEIIKMPITEWKGLMVNDFEKSIFPQYPAIATIKETLYENGALYASMSGSGSSVFGIFKEEVHLQQLFGNHFYWEGFL